MTGEDRKLLVVGFLAALVTIILAFWVVGCAELPTEPPLAAAKAPSGASTIDTLIIASGKFRIYDSALALRGDTVVSGEGSYHCAFPRFKNGTIGEPKSDPSHCATLYRLWVPDSLKAVNKQQRAVLDTLGWTKWTATMDIQS